MVAIACLTYAGALAFAYYNYLGIRGRTSGWRWHAAQYCFLALFCSAFYLAGGIRLDWHNFGEMSGLMLIGVPIYVFVLHWLNGIN